MRFILRRAVDAQDLALHAKLRPVLAVGAALPEAEELLEPFCARCATRHVAPELALPPVARRTQRFGPAQRVYCCATKGAGHVPSAFKWSHSRGLGHFDHTNQIYSKISRDSIDCLKEVFKDDMSKDDWKCVIKLKKILNVE